MRRASLTLLTLSLLFAFYSLLPLEAYAQNSGQSIFSETKYDFKGIPRYTQPRHSFVFTNNGKEDLKLVAARVSCQCTKVFIPEKRIFKSGEKGEVVAQIDAVRFTGARHVTITVTFQRGASVFEIPLNVEGVIIENVSLDPQIITFLVDQDVKQQGSPNTPLQLDVKSSNRTKQVNVVYPGLNETVARFVSSSPFLDVKVGKPTRISTGTQTTIYVSVKNNAPAGYIDATIQLWSNGASGATPLTLNVTGVVRAPLTVSPGALTFYTPERGEVITKNFVVSAPSEFKLKAVESPCKAVTCKFNPNSLRSAKVCVVPVTFTPTLLNDNTDAIKLKIETTDGRVLFLDVKISEGNYSPEAVEIIEARMAAERQAALISSNSIPEKESSTIQISSDRLSTAGVSVSGAANQEMKQPSSHKPPASANSQNQRVNSAPITIPPPPARPTRQQPAPSRPSNEQPFMPFGGFFAPWGGGY